jgi:hypothetical protein
MMIRYTKTAIVLGSAKEALLYFDHIIPVTLHLEMFRAGNLVLPPGFHRQILPPELRQAPQFMEELGVLSTSALWFGGRATVLEFIRREASGDVYDYPLELPRLPDHEFASAAEVFARAFSKFVADFGLKALPIDCFGNLFSEEDGGQFELVISLRSLRLADVSRCSWEQILEFRRDDEARDKLRRLRLFAYENYAGKSKDYIEDDILKRIADYDQAIKQWGFETTQSALNMLLNSKIMGGALTGSLVSTLFGAPTLAVATGVAGGALEIGRIALEVSKQRFALRKLITENPVSYISHVRSKLGNSNDA